MKFTTKAVTLVLLSALIQSALSAPSVTSNGDGEEFGKILASIWKVSILVVLVLMVIDAIQRFTGMKLGVAHGVRFIWFIYGTATMYVIAAGQGIFRGYNEGIFYYFNQKIFRAYFGSGFVRFFKNKINIAGVGG